MQWRKSAVYDVLHKTTASFFIALTAASCAYVVYRGAHWVIGMNLSAIMCQSVLCRNVESLMLWWIAYVVVLCCQIQLFYFTCTDIT